LRSSAQNAWLNTLRRLSMPSEAQLQDLSEFRMLLGGKLRGKFRGIVVCDAMAGYGMAARPCVDRVAHQWLCDTFAEDVDVVSSLELASLLEKNSIEDRHRLVLLFVQEPHAWVARAQLGGFYGAFLAQLQGQGEQLEFLGREEATKLASWLRGPLECAGNVHSDGLMSLWSWFVQDLTKAAAAPKYRHVALCRAEDLLFNAPKLAESLSQLGLRRLDSEVTLPVRTTWWRQAIQPYRQAGGFTMEEAAAIDMPIAGLRGALGYDGTADWYRWASLAEQQMSDFKTEFEAGTSLVPPDSDDGNAARVDPRDGHEWRLNDLCKKFGASLSQFDAEQYFWSHCWPSQEAAPPCTSTFSFEGHWTYSSGSLEVKGGAVHWQSGLVTYINATSDLSFDMALDGEIFQGRLQDAGNRLVFSDGDVWTRCLQATMPNGSYCHGNVPKAEAEKSCQSAAEEEFHVQTEVEGTEDLGEKEPPAGEKQIVAAVSEVLFKAVAKQEAETVHLGLQQVSLLGQEAVQDLLSCRDEQGDSLLHLAVAGARHCPDSASTSCIQIVKTLLLARASVNDSNRSGATAWHLACNTSNSAMEKLLEPHRDPKAWKDKPDVTLVKPFKAQLERPEKVTSEASTRPTRSSSLGSLPSPEQRTNEESAEDQSLGIQGANLGPLDLLRIECKSNKVPVTHGCTEAELVERLAQTLAPAEGVGGRQKLAGVRVVDVCLLPAGPFSGAALVGQGAQVVKIQPDPALGKAMGTEQAEHLVLQLQKSAHDWTLVPQPLALDLRFDHNQRVLDEILQCSQCLIHSFRANTAERLGLGKALQNRYPDLLVISISGQAKSTGSLFAFDAAVTEGSSTSAVQHITPDVAAEMILQSLRTTKTDRHVRVSVMNAS